MDEIELKNGDTFTASFVGVADRNLIVQIENSTFMEVASAFSKNENVSSIKYQGRIFTGYKMDMILIEENDIRVNLSR